MAADDTIMAITNALNQIDADLLSLAEGIVTAQAAVSNGDTDAGEVDLENTTANIDDDLWNAITDGDLASGDLFALSTITQHLEVDAKIYPKAINELLKMRVEGATKVDRG